MTASARSRCSGGYVAQQSPLGDHRLHVEAVAARADQHEQGVEPVGADGRPVPVAEEGAAVGGQQDVVVADVGVDQGLPRRPTSAKPAASAAASSPCGEVAGRRSTWSQYAGQVADLLGDRVESEAGRAGGEQVGQRLERVEAGVQLAEPPRPPRRPRLDVLQAEHDPVGVDGPEQARGGDGVGQGAAACAPPRGTTRRTVRWAAVEAAFTKWRDPSAQVSTDAKPGVKPPPCDAADTTGDPQRCSISRPHGRRQVRPLQAAGGAPVRDRAGNRGAHRAILTHRPTTVASR